MKTKYRNIAFLAELLINILVFSISCAILVGLFGRAALLARQTREENFASTQIYALFETMKARGPAALTTARQEGDGRYVCHYDSDWQLSVEHEPAYVITLDVFEQTSEAGELCRVQARATGADGEEIVAMETQTYRPAEGGGT